MNLDWIIGIDATLFVMGVPFVAAKAAARIPMPWLARLAITGSVPGALAALQLTTRRDLTTGAPLVVMLIGIGWLLGAPWKILLQGVDLRRTPRSSARDLQRARHGSVSRDPSRHV